MYTCQSTCSEHMLKDFFMHYMLSIMLMKKISKTFACFAFQVQKFPMDSDAENRVCVDVSKENHPIPYSKPGFCFTPSANDESSLAR